MSKDRAKDEAALKKGAGRRNDKSASKGGSAADADTRKALQGLKKLLGG